MSSFLGGFAQGLSGLPGAISGIRKEHEKDKELGEEADIYYTYFKDQLSKDAQERWQSMKGREKWQKMQALRFGIAQDIDKRDRATKEKKADFELRHQAVTTDLDRVKLWKEMNPAAVPQPGTIFKDATGKARGVWGPDGKIHFDPAPPTGGVAIDTTTGLPQVNVGSNVFYDPQGGAHLLTDAQRNAELNAEAARKAQAEGTEIPGMTGINKELVEQRGRLAEGRSGRYTLFTGVTVGTPRTDVIKGLEARKAELMKQFGTKAPPPVAAGPAATPAAAPPTGGAAPAGKVRVIAPNGTSGTIPAEQLPVYIKAGYRQASAEPAAGNGAGDFMSGLEQFMV